MIKDRYEYSIKYTIEQGHKTKLTGEVWAINYTDAANQVAQIRREQLRGKHIGKNDIKISLVTKNGVSRAVTPAVKTVTTTPKQVNQPKQVKQSKTSKYHPTKRFLNEDDNRTADIVKQNPDAPSYPISSYLVEQLYRKYDIVAGKTSNKSFAGLPLSITLRELLKEFTHDPVLADLFKSFTTAKTLAAEAKARAAEANASISLSSFYKKNADVAAKKADVAARMAAPVLVPIVKDKGFALGNLIWETNLSRGSAGGSSNQQQRLAQQAAAVVTPPIEPQKDILDLLNETPVAASEPKKDILDLVNETPVSVETTDLPARTFTFLGLTNLSNPSGSQPQTDVEKALAFGAEILHKATTIVKNERSVKYVSQITKHVKAWLATIIKTNRVTERQWAALYNTRKGMKNWLPPAK